MTMSGREIVGTPQLALQWARIQARLQAEVGEVEYRTWLRTMTLAGLDGDELTHHLPTRFLRDWVRKHYGDRVFARAVGGSGDLPLLLWASTETAAEAAGHIEGALFAADRAVALAVRAQVNIVAILHPAADFA
jgi:hypothetical protein